MFSRGIPMPSTQKKSVRTWKETRGKSYQIENGNNSFVRDLENWKLVSRRILYIIVRIKNRISFPWGVSTSQCHLVRKSNEVIVPGISWAQWSKQTNSFLTSSCFVFQNQIVNTSNNARNFVCVCAEKSIEHSTCFSFRSLNSGKEIVLLS